MIQTFRIIVDQFLLLEEDTEIQNPWGWGKSCFRNSLWWVPFLDLLYVWVGMLARLPVSSHHQDHYISCRGSLLTLNYFPLLHFTNWWRGRGRLKQSKASGLHQIRVAQETQRTSPWKLTCPPKPDHFQRNFHHLPPLIFSGYASFRAIFMLYSKH